MDFDDFLDLVSVMSDHVYNTVESRQWLLM